MYEFLDYQAQDVMTRDVVTLEPGATLQEASELFEQQDFNALPVVDASGSLLGILTKLDVLRAFEFDDEHVFPPYSEIMTRGVASVQSEDVKIVQPRTPLPKVLHLMIQERRKSFPVVDQGRLVGIIAREDVMQALTRAAQGLRPEPMDDPY
jgi:CBS domain-containing protein